MFPTAYSKDIIVQDGFILKYLPTRPRMKEPFDTKFISEHEAGWFNAPIEVSRLEMIFLMFFFLLKVLTMDKIIDTSGSLVNEKYRTTNHHDLTPILRAMKSRDLRFLDAKDILDCDDLNAFQYMRFLEGEGLIAVKEGKINPIYTITPSGLAQLEIMSAESIEVLEAPPRFVVKS